MNDVLIVVGLILCGVLVLIPVVMIARIAFGIGAAWFDHRRAESQRITLENPRLGPLTSTNERYWSGEHAGMYISIESVGSPPNATQIDRVTSMFENLPLLADRAREFLVASGALIGSDKETNLLEPFAIDINTDSSQTLYLGGSDLDGWYWVRFRDQMPMDAGFDD